MKDDLDERQQRQVAAFDAAIALILGPRPQLIPSRHYRVHGGRCFLPATGEWFTVPPDANTKGLYCVPGWL